MILFRAIQRHILATLYSIALFFLRIYWNIYRPKTFGVRLIIEIQSTSNHTDSHTRSRTFIAIRHSYGNTKTLTFPGGGYRPNKERAIDACIRETREEIGIDLRHFFTSMNTVESYIQHVARSTNSAEGKIDTVDIFYADLRNAEIHIDTSYIQNNARLSTEIQELIIIDENECNVEFDTQLEIHTRRKQYPLTELARYGLDKVLKS